MMRRVLKEADRAGRTLEIVPPSAIPALLPRFRRISDEWLAEKRGREKGFSLGRFDEAYLRRFPAAVIRAPDAAGISRIVAFANLWCGAPGGEVSPDLMRRSADAPRCVMDLLFVRLLQWAVEAGYSRVNLGMAPLAGLSGDPRSPAHLTPFWHRAGSFIYGRGEPFYHFRGLRAYKSKFSPVWEPRYLACPNGIVLPRVLANVATLIAGGVTGIVRK
jgi:phosphatidylglycerol lysyltransferase